MRKNEKFVGIPSSDFICPTETENFEFDLLVFCEISSDSATSLFLRKVEPHSQAVTSLDLTSGGSRSI